MTTTPAGSPPPAELTRQIELLMAKNERLVTMLEAARAVMLDGAGLADIARPLAVMAAMTALFLALGAGTFRWTQD